MLPAPIALPIGVERKEEAEAVAQFPDGGNGGVRRAEARIGERDGENQLTDAVELSNQLLRVKEPRIGKG